MTAASLAPSSKCAPIRLATINATRSKSSNFIVMGPRMSANFGPTVLTPAYRYGFLAVDSKCGRG